MKKLDKTTFMAIVTGLFTGTVHADNSENRNTEVTPRNPTTLTAPRVSPPTSAADEVQNADFAAPRVLNIGDSRTVGMYFSENNHRYSNSIDTQDSKGNLWFAKVSQGFKWFEDNLTNIKNLAQNCNIVVINLGVNDLAQSADSRTVADKYINTLNKLAENWVRQGKNVFFSSSNPVGPQYRGFRTFNQKINNFNQYMKNGLSSNITFIDTNSYIKDKLQDKDFDRYGLHYTPAVNRDIHRYIEVQIATTWAKTNHRDLDLLSVLQKPNNNTL